jgi:protein-tyrosine-phosphatase
MAEQIAKKMLEEMGLSEKIKVKSAGVAASLGGRLPEGTIRALKEVGVVLKNYTTTPLNKKMVEEARLILAMGEEHKEQILSRYPSIEGKIFLFNEFAGLGKKGILDPIGCSFEAYETCLQQIKRALPRIIERIKNEVLNG